MTATVTFLYGGGAGDEPPELTFRFVPLVFGDGTLEWIEGGANSTPPPVEGDSLLWGSDGLLWDTDPLIWGEDTSGDDEAILWGTEEMTWGTDPITWGS